MTPLLTRLRSMAGANSGHYECCLSIQEVREIVRDLEGKGWQDINSAPRDGTVVLAYIAPTWRDSSPGVGIMLPMCWRDGYWWDDIDRGFGEPVTHWMPLPEPPAAPPLSSPAEVNSSIDSMGTKRIEG